MLLSSTCSLRKLRNLCSRLNKRLSQSHGTITEKNLHISQLEDAVKHLGAKVETTTEEAEKKSKDVAELHLKLNENYRLVAELSSDNLRYVLQIESEWNAKHFGSLQIESRTYLKIIEKI